MSHSGGIVLHRPNEILKEVQFADLKDFLFGKELGWGVYRRVYEYRPDKSFVIKAALEDPSQNIIEYRIWEEIREVKDVAKWFAPTVAISPCGLYLVQKRVEYRPKSEYPDKVPTFFTDLKYSNYGWLNGQLVCVDYGGFIITNGINTKRLRRAKWWE